jgi:uncharacterized membrane protein
MAEGTMTDGKPQGLTDREKRDQSPERMLFFSDGVFAIIITILVLEIKIPELGSDIPLSDSLAEMRPSVVAFIVSFLIVGMYWIAHRSLFTQVRYIDRNTLWLNLLFLMPVALVPFAAGVLSEYADEPSALHVYGVVLIIVSVLLLILDFYLIRHPGLLWQEEDKRTRRVSIVAYGSPLIVYLIALVVAGWYPLLSLALFFAIPVMYFLVVTFLKTDPRTTISAEDL